MSDPAEEFRKLAEVVAEMRLEVKKGLERTAPDYGRDLARILTALQEIEKKPALRMAAEVLERRIGNAAAEGTKEAAEAFREGARVLYAVPDRDERHVSRRQYFWTLGLVAALFVGCFAGTWLGAWVLPNSVIVTSSGCSFIGGTFSPAQHASKCVCLLGEVRKPIGKPRDCTDIIVQADN